MAKIPFSKLKLKINEDVATLHLGTEDEPLDVEIKQYIPIDEKFALIANILNDSVDVYNFYNPVRIEAFYYLYMIDAYTNIKLPKEKAEETGKEVFKDPSKTYDLLASTGLKDDICAAIPQSEAAFIYTGAFEMIKSIYQYNTSVLGILDGISNNYQNMDDTVKDIAEKLSDKENMGFLKDVVTKLG